MNTAKCKVSSRSKTFWRKSSARSLMSTIATRAPFVPRLTAPSMSMKPDASTRVQIRNYVQSKTGDRLDRESVGLLAPAWEIDLLDWDKSDPDKFRSPQVTGHWIVGLPKALALQNLKLNELLAESEELPFKEFSYGDGKVQLWDVDRGVLLNDFIAAPGWVRP